MFINMICTWSYLVIISTLSDWKERVPARCLCVESWEQLLLLWSIRLQSVDYGMISGCNNKVCIIVISYILLSILLPLICRQRLEFSRLRHRHKLNSSLEWCLWRSSVDLQCFSSSKSYAGQIPSWWTGQIVRQCRCWRRCSFSFW